MLQDMRDEAYTIAEHGEEVIMKCCVFASAWTCSSIGSGAIFSPVSMFGLMKNRVPNRTLPLMPVGNGVAKSFDDIAINPKSLWGKSAAEVENLLGEGWTRGTYGSKGTGWKFTKGDQAIFYHPGGGKAWWVVLRLFKWQIR